jgi:phosphoribosylanthranilate isomerase
MALGTFVKVSKVNNLSDARYCAGMGVDIIGFNLVPETLHYMSPEKFSGITEWLAGVDFAGEFEELSAAEILKLAKAYPIQYIQISNPLLLAQLSESSLPLILKVDMDKQPDMSALRALMEPLAERVTYFLFETEQEAYEEDKLQQILALAEDFPVLLGYGVKATNVHQLIAGTKINGIALMGEEELKPGYKDFEKLAEILELIESDDFEN